MRSASSRGGCVGGACTSISSRLSAPSSSLGRQLERPPLPVPVPEARSPPGEPEVLGVPVGGTGAPRLLADRLDAVAHAVEPGQTEPGADVQLRLALGAHRSARARSAAASCNRCCAFTPEVVGTLCHRPSGSSCQLSTSSARFTARISSRRAAQGGIGDRRRGLHPAIEVPRHQVGRPDVVVDAPLRRAEAEDPRVLEVAADERAHADRLRQPGEAGSQAADAAHDQVDLGAGLRRLVQRVDHVGVDEAVHLQRDAPVGCVRLAADHVEDALAHRDRARRGARR